MLTAVAAGALSLGALAWGARSEDQYASRTVIVRAEPDRDGEILAREPRGAQLRLKARAERADGVPWRRITEGPLEGGYVSGRNVLDRPPPDLDRGEPGPGAARIIRKASVRRGPSAHAREIGVVEAGDSVYRVGVVEGSWGEILLEDGGVGYVAADAFARPKARPVPVTPAPTTATPFPNPAPHQAAAPAAVASPPPTQVAVKSPVPAPVTSANPAVVARAPEPAKEPPAKPKFEGSAALALTQTGTKPAQSKATGPAKTQVTTARPQPIDPPPVKPTKPAVVIRADAAGQSTGLVATCQSVSSYSDAGASQTVMCRDPGSGTWIRQGASRTAPSLTPAPVKTTAAAPAPVAPKPTPTASRPPARVASAKWLSRPWEGDIADAFPREAYFAGVSGAVALQCRVGSGGRMTDCDVLSETPRGMGFAEAALDLSYGYRLQPFDTAGQPTTGRLFNFTVPFRFDPRGP